MDQPAKIRPSLYHCLWSIPFLAVGIGGFIFTLFHRLSHITDNLTQVVVPGSAQLALLHGKTYTVFLEEESVVNGKIYSTTESVNGLECNVNSVPDGATIPIHRDSTTTTYSLGSRSGRSVLEFEINHDGQYRFACNYPRDSKGPVTVMAVGSCM